MGFLVYTFSSMYVCMYVCTVSICTVVAALNSVFIIAIVIQIGGAPRPGHEPEAKGEGGGGDGDGDGDIHRTPESNVDGDEGGIRSCAGGGWVYFCIRGLAYIHIVNIE
jgi:hypothetical protein